MAQNTIVGVFQSENLAKEVAEDLKQEGFSGSDIHIIDREGKEHQNWFSRLFGSRAERETLAYRGVLRHGQAVVALDTEEDEIERAADIMERHGALDIRDEEKGNAPDIRGEKLRETGQSIPVIEEQVDMGKRRVLHGSVRVYSHDLETPVEEKVRVTEEKAKVERQPVGRPVSAAEVVTGKEAVEREETIRDTVRRTEVKVEPLTGETRTETIEIPADIAADFRKNFSTQYAGRNYTEYEMAYRFGYVEAGLATFSGKDFDQVETQLRQEFEVVLPKGDWQLMRNAIRYGWARRRGRA